MSSRDRASLSSVITNSVPILSDSFCNFLKDLDRFILMQSQSMSGPGEADRNCTDGYRQRKAVTTHKRLRCLYCKQGWGRHCNNATTFVPGVNHRRIA